MVRAGMSVEIDDRQLRNHGRMWTDFADAISGQTFQQRASRSIGKGGREKWYNWMSDRASTNYSELHHVYEWDRVGERGAELFSFEFKPGGAGGGGTWVSELGPAKTQPSERTGGGATPGGEFIEKAKYFENFAGGVISAKGDGRLRFFWDRGQAPMIPMSVKSVRMPRYSTYGKFQEAWEAFWQDAAYEEVAVPATRAAQRAMDRAVFPEMDRATRGNRRLNKSAVRRAFTDEWEKLDG